MLLQCPRCRRRGGVRVVTTDRALTKLQIRRRRECVMCGSRFTTYEVVVQTVRQIEADQIVAQLHERVPGTFTQYQQLRELLERFFSVEDRE